MMETPELETLLTPIRASFHARRRDVAAQCAEIARQLDAYLRAYDAEILRELALTHSLPSPATGTGLRTADLAVTLLAAVQSLPELSKSETRAKTTQATKPQESGEAKSLRESLRPTKSSIPVAAAKPTISSAPPPPGVWPLLSAAISTRPLVIVGGPPHLERLHGLSVDADTQVEWVDTTRQGTHAIGNLERRIKDHRIAAVIILEGLVQHRHSDPLISTARIANVPCGYAGKGGRSAIAQCLGELERMLENHR